MGRSGLQTGCDSSAPPVHFVCCQHSQPRAKGHVRRWSITPCCLLCPHWHNAAVPALPTCLSVSPQVMLGAVCARTMRMRLQLGVPVLGTLCFVHGNITVQKTLQNITVGQKSCDMAGGTCRPCHLQAQQNALRSICLHSEPHPPLLPQSKGGRCLAHNCRRTRKPNTGLPHFPSACCDWKDLNNQSLHSFLTSLPQALHQICFSLILPPQRLPQTAPTSGWQQQQEVFASLSVKRAQPPTQLQLHLASTATNKKVNSAL